MPGPRVSHVRRRRLLGHRSRYCNRVMSYHTLIAKQFPLPAIPSLDFLL